MKLSVITVVYNNEKTIADAMQSVISQTYKDVEYIIVDGNSSDSTLDVINNYKAKVSKVISEPDNGIYDAMNKGIMMSTGEVVGILNSDDLYMDEKILEEVVELFIKDDNLDIVYCDLVYVSKKDVNKIRRKWISEMYYEKFFEDGHVPPHPTLFVKKKVYLEAGKFDPHFRFAADYEFMLRIFKKYNFKSYYLNRTAVKMRLGGATNKSITNVIRGNIEIFQSWGANNLIPPWTFFPSRFIKRVKQFIK